MPDNHDEQLRVALPSLMPNNVSSIACLSVQHVNVADKFVPLGAFPDTPYTYYRSVRHGQDSWTKLWCKPRLTGAVWMHLALDFALRRSDVIISRDNATFRHFRSYVNERHETALSWKLPISENLASQLREAVKHRNFQAAHVSHSSWHIYCITHPNVQPCPPALETPSIV
jgi:hypothetical protein